MRRVRPDLSVGVRPRTQAEGGSESFCLIDLPEEGREGLGVVPDRLAVAWVKSSVVHCTLCVQLQLRIIFAVGYGLETARTTQSTNHPVACRPGDLSDPVETLLEHPLRPLDDTLDLLVLRWRRRGSGGEAPGEKGSGTECGRHGDGVDARELDERVAGRSPESRLTVNTRGGCRRGNGMAVFVQRGAFPRAPGKRIAYLGDASLYTCPALLNSFSAPLSVLTPPSQNPRRPI